MSIIDLMKKPFSKLLRNQQITLSITTFTLVIIITTLFVTTFRNIDAKAKVIKQEIFFTKHTVNDSILRVSLTIPSYEQIQKSNGATSTTVADFLKQPNVESGENGGFLKIKDSQNTNDITTSNVRVEKTIDVVEDSQKYANRNSDKKITLVSNPTQYHTTGNLNMRKGPGQAYTLIKIIPKGQNVSYKGRKGTWYEVSYGGKTGYVSSTYLKAGKIKRVSSSYRGHSMLVTSTAYTAYCSGCSGRTKIGIDLRKNPYRKVIAVDPRVIPLRTMVYVNGYGLAVAGDTGSAIKGRKIDVFMPSTRKANGWGRRTVKIVIQR